MSNEELSPVLLRELQLKSLEMFKYFKKICDENDLLIYFCGGCCIGSLRHQGFVPWDDDIDVFMPREDYEKLKKIWPEKADKRYSIYYPQKGFCDRNPFLTIRDAETTFIKPYQEDLDINQGLMLDIMPLDGCPAGFARKMQKMWAMVYSLFTAQMVPEKHGGIVTFASKFLLGLFHSKKVRNSIAMHAEKKMTKYKIKDCDKITELTAGPHYMQNEYPKECFASAVYKKFEDIDAPIPVGYDTYLKTAFGDYMQMPPKEKQVAHHDFNYCDLKNSYKNYKGKYYLKESK